MLGKKKKALGKSFVVTVSAVAAGASMLACGGLTDPNVTANPPPPPREQTDTVYPTNPPAPPPEPTYSTNPPAPPTEPTGPRICPFPRPADGSACDLSVHNEICSWGPSPDCPDTYQCLKGAWTLIDKGVCPPPPPPVPFCPFPAPADGSSCTPGVHAAQCTYGGSPDCPNDLFTCDPATGTWVRSNWQCD